MCGVYQSATFQATFFQYSYILHETLADIVVPDTIGGKIRKLRHSLNITQMQFAKSIHRGFGTVTKWEQELTTPSEDALDEIIRVYNLNNGYFKV
ncbi:helix-turn-helix domain-containing protein [Clostridium butyricum]|uniref:helix-turn-helix domain-containing protein n=1 Tax=Clostridium butyricum TaxID=1492 RepID=UPI00374FB504